MTESIATPDFRAIRERADAATPGPWKEIASRDVMSAVVAPGRATICMDCENPHDATFISNARRDIPVLLDHIGELNEQLADARDQMGKECLRKINATHGRDALFAALKEINAYWESGNFTRKPELWEQIRSAIKAAEKAI